VAQTTPSQAQPFVDQHRQTLDRAVAAIGERGYWTPHPENPQAYGDVAEARKHFDAHLGQDFPLRQGGSVVGTVGAERSPYGPRLGVRYPRVDVDALIAAAQCGTGAWRDAGPLARAAVGLEILHRVNQRSLEIGHAVMHTSGQAYLMAFQAGGPHAQDRGLEALAYAYAEMTRVPQRAYWEKPGRREPLRMD
jgi:hypothetical protein